MKKVAFILLLIFSATQIIPAVLALLKQGKGIVCTIDEEKSSEKGKEETKNEQKKYFISFANSESNIIARTNFSDITIRKVISPYLEYLAPPPDNC